MTLIKHIFRDLRQTGFQEATAKHRSFKSNNKFGIELELEEVHPVIWETSFKYWLVVEESSLRNRGAEFILKKPLNGDALYRAIGELFNHPVVQEANPSWRCGIHIHIDVRNWSVEKLAAFTMHYMAAEMELFSTFGNERVYSNFCVPLNFQPFFARKVLNGSVHSLDDANKYSALNYIPMRRLGSVEWRAAKASTDAAFMRAIVSSFCKLIKATDDYLESSDRFAKVQELFPVEDTLNTILFFQRGLSSNLNNLSERYGRSGSERQREMLERVRSAIQQPIDSPTFEYVEEEETEPFHF